MITTVTLNPAIDRTAVVPRFTPGIVNRMVSLRSDVGGKGLNVSKCLKSFGCPTTAVGFFGGYTGIWLKERLAALEIPLLAVEIAGENRSNLKILDPEAHRNTDINEPGPVIAPAELAQLLAVLDGHVAAGDTLILSGSLPGGVPVTLYRDLTARFRAKGAAAYVDADGESFREAVSAAPELVKPNQEELERFAGRPLPDWASVLDAARGLLDRGIGTVVVSRGGDGALLCRRDGVWKAPGLSVPVGSTVGAGDSMVAALAYGQETGMDWPDRLRLAVAVSAASVMCRGTQVPEHDAIARLYRQVTIEEV